MNKILSVCTFLLTFLPFVVLANEDLTDLDILEKHFENTEKFTTWYKSLDQYGKNQALAGTIVECRPDLAEIALKNGGDVKTEVYTVYQSLHTHQYSDKYDNLIYTTGSVEEILEDAASRQAGFSAFDSLDDGYSLFMPFGGPTTSDKVSLLTKAAHVCPNDIRMQLFKLLLDNGADINASNSRNENVFEYTIREPYTYKQNTQDSTITTEELLDFLFKHIPENGLNPEISTSLITNAIIRERKDLLSLYKKYQLKISLETKAAHQAMFDAAAGKSAGSLRLLKQFIKNGIDVNFQNKNGETALMYAITPDAITNPTFSTALGNSPADNAEKIKILLENGANVNLADNRGNTPLFLAVSLQNLQVTELLLANGANINMQNKDGDTVITAATFDINRRQPLNYELMKLLVDKGADVAVRNKKDETALPKIAQTFGNADVIDLLLKNTSSKSNLKKDKAIALLNAVCTKPTSYSDDDEREDIRTVQTLLKHGADINALNYVGETALFTAAECHHIKIAEILLKNGIDTFVKNNNNQTVFEKICGRKKKDIPPELQDDPESQKFFDDYENQKAADFCQLHPTGVELYNKSGRNNSITLKKLDYSNDSRNYNNVSSSQAKAIFSKTQQKMKNFTDNNEIDSKVPSEIKSAASASGNNRNTANQAVKITPQQIDFGQVTLGNTTDRKLTIGATENHTIRILSIELADTPLSGFSYESDCGARKVFDEDTCSISMRWTPSKPQTIHSRFQIEWKEFGTSDNNKQRIDIDISGTAVTAP